jgi:transposase
MWTCFRPRLTSRSRARWWVLSSMLSVGGSICGSTFPKGARFPCPECERADCPVHDTEPHTWRHLNFFQHEAYLHARVPRVRCPEHGVKQVQVPWARGRSDFTLLFEALVMALVKEMPVKAIARLVGEHDTKIWRVVHYYVDQAVEAQDLSRMQELGIDDTSFRRGQSYMSVFCDLDASERRAVFVADGRGQETVAQFAGFLGAHGGDPENIREVCQDMSQAYLAGVREHLQGAGHVRSLPRQAEALGGDRRGPSRRGQGA